MSVAAFIAGQRAAFGVPHAVSCRALGVSQSWLYKWRDRPPTPRQARRVRLSERIGKLFAASGGTYGSPRIVLDLRAEGWRVSVNTVAILMAEQGLVARAVKHRHGLTRAGRRPAANDYVRRQFRSVAPDLLWCGDLTEIITDEGKLYQASVLDLFSRRCLGYAFSAHHDADVAEAALLMAVAARGGDVEGVIFHSDRGSEGEFNRSSQHLDHGGVRWVGTRSWSGCPRGRAGSGPRTGRCGRRCVRRVGLSPRALCSGSSGD